MRELLTKHLEPMIWCWCTVSILTSIVFGTALLRISNIFLDGYTLMLSLAVGLGGITLTLVLTGLFFNLIDTRQFTKHTAVALHKSRQEGKI